MCMFVGLCRPILAIHAWMARPPKCIVQSPSRAAAHLCSDSHNEHGLSFADVSRPLLGRMAPASSIREGAYVVHANTPGSGTGHCVARSFSMHIDEVLVRHVKDARGPWQSVEFPVDVPPVELPSFIYNLLDFFFVVNPDAAVSLDIPLQR